MLSDDPLWYQDAIIYQLHVRAFADSDGDGTGDFRGLTQRLDYLQELGVTAIWLQPFYPSPRRDDGYDIAEYTNVHASYGTLADFQEFLDQAHARGLRVITEMVLNHTSDQHAWFQRARRAPPGSVERDFYVWSDRPDRYRHARVVFQDFEPSNWTWDTVARAYYWHRFFHHQPDLNFENPEVHRAVLEALDFWLERGVDGARLDAIPYLYEREGTACENLPETHEFLRKLRRHVDERFESRMLLAEANQWPEDAVAFFGTGDECHMAFHFPLMPRLFMAVQQEDRFPIIDILQQTPTIPGNCQWTMFLRNHDELTLETVTDEERDYMYRVYAEDPRARINLGIRRRLAPLLRNDRRLIELLNCLLMTLPGTPVIYYGDEIGMGDNIYLGDRDAVRTPMQWNGDSNAGFSRANPQQLYLPVIVDPEFHYSTVNVAVQQGNRNSLLSWMRRLIAIRKRSSVFGRGTIEFLLPDNPKVLAFIREYDDEVILVVANLSRYAQHAELNLSRFEGRIPVEVFGGAKFPEIGKAPYSLTLAEHAYLLFTVAAQDEFTRSVLASSTPIIVVASHPAELFEPWLRARLEATLPRFLPLRPWYLGRTATMQSVILQQLIPLEDAEGTLFGYLVAIRVDFAGGAVEHYLTPLAWEGGEPAAERLARRPESVLLRVAVGRPRETMIIYDACDDPAYQEWWLRVMQAVESGAAAPQELAPVEFESTAIEAPVKPTIQTILIRPGVAWMRFGDSHMLQLFHATSPGPDPLLDLHEYLRRHAPADLITQWLGGWNLTPGRGPTTLVAMLSRFVPNEGTAWRHALDHLRQFFEETDASLRESAERGQEVEPVEYPTIWELVDGKGDESPVTGSHSHWLQLIGERTAQLHRTLSRGTDQVEFEPLVCTPHYQRGMFQGIRSRVTRVLQSLERAAHRLGPDHPDLQTLLRDREPITSILQDFRHRDLSFLRIRCHGNYGLERLLFTGKDYILCDLSGDLRKTPSERRVKRATSRDLAQMIWSFDRAVAMARDAGHSTADLNPFAELWFRSAVAAFLRGYLRMAEGEPFLVEDRDEFAAILNSHLLDAAFEAIERHTGEPLAEFLSLLASAHRIVKLL